jgi:hypothetical protein
MIGKAILGLFTIILLFTIGTTPIIQGVHNWRTQAITQSSVEATAPQVTTADVVLNKDLFTNDTSEVISITSSITETPVATGYVSATNTLTISALTDDTSRTLTIMFYAPVDDPIMTGIGPFLTPLIFLFIIGMIVWGVFGTGRKGGK